MKKVLSLMGDSSELIAEIRKQRFGANASSQEYRDSFVLNDLIERFASVPPEVLMQENITKLDQDSGVKTSAKSVTLRASVAEQLENLANKLKISEAETVRRILYFYSLSLKEEKEVGEDSSESRLTKIRNEILELADSLSNAMKHLAEITCELDRLEGEIISKDKKNSQGVN